MLSTDQLAVIEQRITNESKSAGLAYVLWFFLGTLGIHNFYIGKTGHGIIELLCQFWAWFLFAFSFEDHGLVLFALASLLAWAVMWLIDLFTIPSSINKARQKLREQYIAEFTAETSPAPAEVVPPVPTASPAEIVPPAPTKDLQRPETAMPILENQPTAATKIGWVWILGAVVIAFIATFIFLSR